MKGARLTPIKAISELVILRLVLRLVKSSVSKFKSGGILLLIIIIIILNNMDGLLYP